MIRRNARTARKTHRCGSCLTPIRPGERHLVYVTSPNHPDWGNDKWMTYRECATCCDRYGRAHLLGGAA